jgi:Bacterial regulatory proteins, luxR family
LELRVTMKRRRALRPNRVFVPEIGERLFISRATVKTHLPHMLDKLSVADRAELATFPNAQLAKRAI